MTPREWWAVLVGGGLGGLIGWLLGRRRPPDPDDRPPIVVSNSSVICRAEIRESSHGNGHPDPWTDPGEFGRKQSIPTTAVFGHKHSKRPPGRLQVVVIDGPPYHHNMLPRGEGLTMTTTNGTIDVRIKPDPDPAIGDHVELTFTGDLPQQLQPDFLYIKNAADGGAIHVTDIKYDTPLPRQPWPLSPGAKVEIRSRP